MKTETVVFENEDGTTYKINLVGESLGQFHDDLDLKNAKIIRGVWIRPKCYLLEYIGFNNDKESPNFGKLEKRFHIRSKGISKKYIEKIDNELLKVNYDNMMEGKSITYDGITNFKRNWKQRNGDIGIQTIKQTKIINQSTWDGRIYNADELRWEPII